MRESTWERWQAETDYRIFYPLFHGCLGVSVLLTAMMTPAGTTRWFFLTPRILMNAMRSRSASLAETDTAVSFLEKRLQGFTFHGQPLDVGSASKFVSLAA